MSKRGYISLASLFLAAVAFVRFSQDNSFIWLAVGMVFVSAAAGILFTGIFPKEEQDEFLPRVMSAEDLEITNKAMKDLIASTKSTN